MAEERERTVRANETGGIGILDGGALYRVRGVGEEIILIATK